MNKYEQSIVDRLRYGLYGRFSVTLGADEVHIPMNAIEENEKLRADFARVTAERDAAVEDIKHNNNCTVCAYGLSQGDCETNDYDCENCRANCECKSCRNENNWKWRGMKEVLK